MKTIYISASAIADYLSCPRKYWYRRTKPEDLVEELPKELTMGTIVHDTIEKYHNDKPKGMAFAKEEVTKEAFGAVDRGVIFTCLSNFYDTWKPTNFPNARFETFFRIPYGKTDSGTNVIFSGKFDVISGNTVVDWKTSKSIPHDFDFEVQPIVYRWAFKTMYGKDPNVLFYYLRLKKAVTFSPNEKVTKYLFDNVIPDMLRNVDEDNLPPEGLFKYNGCYRCQYLKHCHNYMQEG